MPRVFLTKLLHSTQQKGTEWPGQYEMYVNPPPSPSPLSLSRISLIFSSTFITNCSITYISITLACPNINFHPILPSHFLSFVCFTNCTNLKNMLFFYLRHSVYTRTNFSFFFSFFYNICTLFKLSYFKTISVLRSNNFTLTLLKVSPVVLHYYIGSLG